ncbi:alpha/beta fold hydrolase [Candidatus Dojkabacteria bacterium]|nr:alpha/beta fold hydrolase [Candidatus Dojkabacteria bacterium]
MGKNFIFIILFLILLVGSLFIVYHKILSSRKKQAYQNTYEFKGYTMSYKVIGQGKPVILLHGSIYSDSWNTFDEKLAENYKVYIPDLPGFGGSDTVKGRVHNTDLFTEALCIFIEHEQLNNVPIVSNSLGTIVSTKAATLGCTKAKLIHVGAPAKIIGWKIRFVNKIPIFIRRIIISTKWGKENLLIPILRTNIGTKAKENNQEFLIKLQTTDPRSLADINYIKAVEIDFPKALSLVENKTVFIYGEKDAQRNYADKITEEYTIIEGAEHNLFRSKPEKTKAKIVEILDTD